MTKVIVIGSGGHGAEIDDYIQYANHLAANKKIEIIGFLDDNPDNYNAYKFSAPLLGPINKHIIDPKIFYVIGIANLKYRRPIVESMLSKGAKFINIIHPNATISRSAKIGTGNIIGPMVNLGPNANLGNYNLLNSRCSLGHDTIIGDFNFISPNVSFSGFSSVGSDNLFGINSATIPNINIGNRNKVMAGMVINKDIANDTTVFYRYKEQIIAKPK